MTRDNEQHINPVREALRERYFVVQERIIELGSSKGDITEEEAIKLAFDWTYFGSVEFPTKEGELPEHEQVGELFGDGIAAREAAMNAQAGDYRKMKAWVDEIAQSMMMALTFGSDQLEIIAHQSGTDRNLLFKRTEGLMLGLSKIGKVLPESGQPLQPSL